jgi:hypothetical protein
MIAAASAARLGQQLPSAVEIHSTSHHQDAERDPDSAIGAQGPFHVVSLVLVSRRPQGSDWGRAEDGNDLLVPDVEGVCPSSTVS